MQKWEYELVRYELHESKKEWIIYYGDKPYRDTDFFSIINQLGKKGWELVTTMPFIRSDKPAIASQFVFVDTSFHWLIFKRPLSTE